MSIGEVACVFDGPHATPRTVDEGPIFLSISTLQDGVVNLAETRHVTPEVFARWTRRVVPQPGDVVFSYETRLGQVAVIPDGLECCLGRRMGLVRFRDGLVMPRFFVYQYLSPPFREFLETQTIHGTTVDRISIKAFPSFRISVPPVDEQRRIVDLLDRATADITIAKTSALRNLESARDVYDSRLREVFDRCVADWEIRTVGECCTVSSGGTPSRNKASYWAGPIPWVSAKDLKSDSIDDGLLHISSEAAECSATKVAPVGSVLILVRGMGLANGVPIAEVIAPVAFNQDIKAIQPPADVVPRFLFLSMKSSLVRKGGTELLSSAAHGTLKIDTDGIRRMTFAVPPRDRQESIISEMNVLCDETQRLESIYQRKAIALDELRSSLLRQAFTEHTWPLSA
jgi:type I restriction enzyme S subunit